jgi:ABC-type cobalamin/Fe3+-siderophores transport system ATPase subunit
LACPCSSCSSAGSMRDPVWRTKAASFRHPGSNRDAVSELSCEIGGAGITAVLGPNGAGKSTLVRLLLGLAAPTRGEVWYRDRRATLWPRPAMAREVGFLPQGEEVVFPLTVREVVAMGRYPHLGPWRAEREGDRAIVAEALAGVEASALTDRRFDTLSGGERQRVRVARALAQSGLALVLDEPTAGLDVRHEVELFVLMRSLASSGRAVVLVTHNLILAARMVDRVLLLSEGRLVAHGPPVAVLTPATLTAVYGWPIEVLPHPGPGSEMGAPIVLPSLAPGGSAQ